MIKLSNFEQALFNHFDFLEKQKEKTQKEYNTLNKKTNKFLQEIKNIDMASLLKQIKNIIK